MLRVVAWLLALLNVPVTADEIWWRDAQQLSLGGLAFVGEERESPYDRFPVAAKATIPSGVWNQSIQSAGVYVEFVTDAAEVWVNYTLATASLALWNMEAAAHSGTDIYALDPTTSAYRWVGQWEGPSSQESSGLLVDGLLFGRPMQYRIHFPLYSRVTSFVVGVPADTALFAPLDGSIPKPGPVVWYVSFRLIARSCFCIALPRASQRNCPQVRHVHRTREKCERAVDGVHHPAQLGPLP